MTEAGLDVSLPPREAGDEIRELTMDPVTLEELARGRELSVRGSDIEVVTIGALNTRSAYRDRMLTFIVDPDLIPVLDQTGIAACLVHESLADAVGDRPMLVTETDPVEAFYALFIDTAESGRWRTLGSRRGRNVQVSSTAVVHEGVQLGDGCVVMDQAVVLPNTRLGDRVTIKPQATVGGDGFEVRQIRGRRTMIPHRGGVWIGDDVQIGSQTCVDRGMFGSFTTIGDETRIDNLVHVGHSAVLDRRGVVAACSELGAITCGEGFWLGPRSAVLQGVHLGHHSYVGIGSVIVRDVPPHALAYGVPAKPQGWVCVCRAKLELDGQNARCRFCGRNYVIEQGTLAELA